MFSVFADSQAKEDALNIFTEDDIREILSTFALDTGEKTSESGSLILSTSKASLIRTEELIAALKERVNQGQGLISIKSVAEEYELDPQIIHDILISIDWVFFTADDISFLTRNAQDEIISKIYTKTVEVFHTAGELSEDCGLRVEVLFRLLASRRNDPALKRYGLIVDQPSTPTTFKDSGVVAYSSLLLEKVKNNVIESISNASRVSEPVSWNSTEFHGLSATRFMELAKEVSNDNGAFPGIFSVEESMVSFTPAKNLVLERDQKLSSVADGTVPYLDLRDMIGPLPGEFRDLNSAEKFVKERYKQVSLSNSLVLSNEWINQQFDQVIAEAKKIGHAGFTKIFASFPELSAPSVNEIVTHRITTRTDFKRVGDFLVENSWIGDITVQAQSLASDLAESIWDKEAQSRPKASIIDLKLNDLLIKKCNLEKPLAEALWRADGISLASSAISAFDSKLEKLDTSSDEQFSSLWSFRVVSKIQLYRKGLSEVPDQALRDQLADLLKLHISSELIPLAVSRAKAKGLLKSPRRKVSSRLAKLQTSLSGAKDYSAVIDELEKFNSQMGIPGPDEAQLEREKPTYLKEMNKTMIKDEDGARIFLCLLIILFSSFHAGVLYATGKFAPKMLKMIKPQLSSKDAQWLDQVKDSIKAGNTTDDMKNKMRLMAFQNLQPVTDQSLTSELV